MWRFARQGADGAFAEVTTLPGSADGRQPALAADQLTGQLWLAWEDFGSNELLLSTGSGKPGAWSEPTVVVAGVYRGGLAAHDGVVQLIAEHIGGADRRILYASSLGEEFGAQLLDGTVDSEMALAVDGAGRPYVVFAIDRYIAAEPDQIGIWLVAGPGI